MLTPGRLGAAFAIYWDDMDRCRHSRAYWSLLHVTVCLPDICAALQSDSGEATGAAYISWCDRYLMNPLLSGRERYWMRCKVLHQGRACIDRAGCRYEGFSFGQPAPTGEIDHLRVEGSTLILDVGCLTDDVRRGVEKWIQVLEASLASGESLNAERYLASLVQVRQFPVPRPAASVSLDPPVLIARSS
jgi:hypothetical protein